jgi:hypothetical protein
MPIGKGTRLEKPRTAAQRRQAAKYATPIAIVPASFGMPDRSWWTEPRTREEFDQAAARERERMRDSKFGTWRVNGTIAEP